MKDKIKKLALHQETIRNLTQEEVKNVAGRGNTLTCHIVSICEICAP